jgi:hypothetical protein
MPRASGELSLTFGSKEADSIAFLLSSVNDAAAPSFIQGAVVITLLGELYKSEDRSGIEPLALANFRDDLRSILAKKGTVLFGDHDYGLAVTLVRGRNGYRLMLDWPIDDLWELPLGEPSTSDLEQWIAVIDEAESRFGQLIGHCDCGIPGHWYEPGQ